MADCGYVSKNDIFTVEGQKQLCFWIKRTKNIRLTILYPFLA